MEKNSAFGLGDATAVEHLEGGVTRKILKYGGKLMLVEVTMPKGGTGSAHKHPHEQISYIARGSFEFTVGEEKRVVKAGDS
ncbi:MAG: cupin domain-containing protein, partial [Clostridiales bacterium]|nr:cupin domain-containing protein [Clostridiales bacterium]